MSTQNHMLNDNNNGITKIKHILNSDVNKGDLIG